MSDNSSKEFKSGQNNGPGFGQQSYDHYGDYLKGLADHKAGRDSNKQ